MGEAAPRIQDNMSDILAAVIVADGTGSHPYAGITPVSTVVHSLSDLADAMHYLCMLHGRHPGVIDHAATRTVENAARLWLVQAADSFAAERAYLTHITVAVGPLPSTAGQNQTEAAVVQQRHALDMLAQSDRRGCAMGSAIALVLDWQAIRKLLDKTALRLGIEPKPCLLPARATTLALAEALDTDEGMSRALQFGARQLLRQHRGLWDLMQTRAALRAR